MTAQHTIDAASGVRLIGGEVMSQDHTRLTRSGAVAYLAHQLHDLTEGRILLAGPKAAMLLDVVDASRPVDLLVRSLPDARMIAGRSQEYSHLRLFCGGLERFVPREPYDLVICLDGPAGTLTPDSPASSQLDTLGRIGSWVAEDGVGLLGLANELGLDEVFRLDLRTMFDANDSWHRGSDGFDRRNLLFPEVGDALEQAGLTAARMYCGYPSRDLMSLLVTPETADSPLGRARVHTLLARAGTGDQKPALVDVTTVAGQFLDAGVVRETAPGWLVLVSRQDVEVPTMPDLLLSEDRTTPHWASVMTLSQSEEGAQRHVISLTGNGDMAERRVIRDMSAVEARPPEGQLLESLLRTECARGNITGLRRLVSTYADFLEDEHSWTEHRRSRFFATPSNVVLDGEGRPAVFDLSWTWAEDIPADLALARGLRDFARRLLGSGAEHPWQPDLTPDALVQTLLAMVGKGWSATTAGEIAQREAELDVVLRGGGPVTESEVLAENLARGAAQATAVAAPSRGYREALSTLGRMSQELHERADQVAWLEASLRERDQRVTELQRRLNRVETSPSYVLGRTLTSPGRKIGDRVVARGKSTALSLLPPRYAAQAERAFKRAGI